MKRREFIAFIGGAMAVWPLAARGQQPAIPVIGFISAGAPEAWRTTAFRRGLDEIGFVEGQSIAIEYRWAEGRYDAMADLVADLLRRRVAVIVTPGSAAAALAAKAATAAVPIVFATGVDPVQVGLVARLNRPDGNITGVYFLNTELMAKRLGLLRELVPGIARVAVLINPANASNAKTTLKDAESAARAVGLHIQVVNASTSNEINSGFASLVRERPDVLLVMGDSFFNSRRFQLVNLASRHAIPAIYADRILAEVGGLMSYGSDIRDVYRQVGLYAGRIIRGMKPVDLPVVQSSKFELVINAETARMLGLTVPPALLAIADEVIE